MVVTGDVTGDVDVDSVVTIIWVGLIGLVVSDGLTSGACVVITSRKVISGPTGSLYDLIVVKNGQYFGPDTVVEAENGIAAGHEAQVEALALGLVLPASKFPMTTLNGVTSIRS